MQTNRKGGFLLCATIPGFFQDATCCWRPPPLCPGVAMYPYAIVNVMCFLSFLLDGYMADISDCKLPIEEEPLLTALRSSPYLPSPSPLAPISRGPWRPSCLAPVHPASWRPEVELLTWWQRHHYEPTPPNPRAPFLLSRQRKGVPGVVLFTRRCKGVPGEVLLPHRCLGKPGVARCPASSNSTLQPSSPL